MMSAKIGLASDLHLEFAKMNPEFFAWRGDVLLLAGDLAPEDRLGKDTQLWDRVSQMATEVYVILGNHEYYHSEIDVAAGHLKEALGAAYPNIRVLDIEVHESQFGFMIWGGTLWADFARKNYTAMMEAQALMNDYRCIRVAARGYSPLYPDDTLGIHNTSLEHLRQSLAAHPDKDFIVMSHHAPSYQSVIEKFRNSPLNGAYTSNLEDFIMGHPQIKTWVHGHLHGHKNYMIGDCNVLLHARGYPGERPAQLPPYTPLDFAYESNH